MMNLYYSPGACSQAPHILLHETGLDHDSTRVDLRSKRTAGGDDYLAINPKGAVPALQLDSGEVLTENAVVLQYIAEAAGDERLLPAPGNLERYRILEWVNFIATELHKSFGPLFKPDAGEDTKSYFRALVGERLDFVDRELGAPFLTGERMTIAEPYLFVITGWAEKMGFALERWPKLQTFRQRMMERPSVRQVMEFEGLLKAETVD